MHSTLKIHFISLMAVVKDLRVLHGLRDELVKQQLSFLLSSVIAVLAECSLVLIKYPVK